MTVAGESDLVGETADRDPPDNLIGRRVEDQDLLAGLDADVEPPPVTGRRQPVGMRPDLDRAKRLGLGREDSWRPTDFGMTRIANLPVRAKAELALLAGRIVLVAVAGVIARFTGRDEVEALGELTT